MTLNKRGPKTIEIIFKQAEGISQEEMEKNLSDAYEILFEEVLKQQADKKS